MIPERHWLYNFRTQVWDTVLPKTDESAMDYLPRDPACASLYFLYRNLGHSLMESLILVLERVVGKE